MADLATHRVPYFFIDAFPEEERGSVWAIRAMLTHMEILINDFLGALELFDYCEGYMNSAVDVHDINTAFLFQRRIFVPARDGAMSIYHFKKAMHGVRRRMNRCPSLKTRVHADTPRLAVKRFNNCFPQSDILRNAVAHAAEEIAKIGEPVIDGSSAFLAVEAESQEALKNGRTLQ